jgi:hypothetical protein
MQELIEHIQQMNSDARQKLAENPTYWIGLLTEDPEHWKSMDITTVEQFNQYLDDCVKHEQAIHEYNHYDR